MYSQLLQILKFGSSLYPVLAKETNYPPWLSLSGVWFQALSLESLSVDHISYNRQTLFESTIQLQYIFFHRKYFIYNHLSSHCNGKFVDLWFQ